MAGEHAALQLGGRRQCREPGKLVGTELPASERRARGRIGTENVPIVVAEDRDRTERDQPLRRAARIKRSRDAIAEIHERLCPDMDRILDHSVERSEVAVDVGEHGDDARSRRHLVSRH